MEVGCVVRRCEEFLNRLQHIFCHFSTQRSDSQCRSRNKDVKNTFALLFLLYCGQIEGQNCKWLMGTIMKCIACTETMAFFKQFFFLGILFRPSRRLEIKKLTLLLSSKLSKKKKPQWKLPKRGCMTGLLGPMLSSAEMQHNSGKHY